MNVQREQKPEPWVRLEHHLSNLRPGDITTVLDTTDKTALAPETVGLVLEALSRADLFEHRGEQYIRR